MCHIGKSSGNDNEKASFCIIKGKRYESFDNHTFFGDTGTSHVMDTDNRLWYNTGGEQAVGVPAPVKNFLDRIRNL